MQQRRIFHPEQLRINTTVILDINAIRHVAQVLRLKSGEAITLFDGTGTDYSATLVSSRRNQVSAKVERILSKECPTRLHLHLAIGISRGERMDFAIQKAVELGVHQITPLFTERTLVKIKAEKLHARLSHWQHVIRHACEQSGRSYLAQLNTAATLNAFVTSFKGTGILLDHRAELGLNQLNQPRQNLTILVGPEGGLAPAERELAQQNEFIGIQLGPRIMRSETAPLAALAALQTLWGDFK